MAAHRPIIENESRVATSPTARNRPRTPSRSADGSALCRLSGTSAAMLGRRGWLPTTPPRQLTAIASRTFAWLGERPRVSRRAVDDAPYARTLPARRKRRRDFSGYRSVRLLVTRVRSAPGSAAQLWSNAVTRVAGDRQPAVEIERRAGGRTTECRGVGRSRRRSELGSASPCRFTQGVHCRARVPGPPRNRSSDDRPVTRRASSRTSRHPRCRGRGRHSRVRHGEPVAVTDGAAERCLREST